MTGLKRQGVKISRFAQDLLDSPKFTITEQREEIELVVRTVADLGLSDGATTEEVYAAAKKQGLELCPPEVGPLLRMRSDTETRLGVFLVVAMEPITDSHGDPSVFCLSRDDGAPWLRAHYAGPDVIWYAVNPFVFRPRKEPSNT